MGLGMCTKMRIRKKWKYIRWKEEKDKREGKVCDKCEWLYGKCGRKLGEGTVQDGEKKERKKEDKREGKKTKKKN